jgi:hypothetical protein
MTIKKWILLVVLCLGGLCVAATNLINLATQVKGVLAVANGGTNLSAATDDDTMVGNGTTWESKALPSCSNATTSKLLYNSSTNTWSCGTDNTSSGDAGVCLTSDYFCINEDWMNAGNTAGNYSWNVFCGGATSVTGLAGHPGYLSGSTGASINGNCNYSLGANGTSGQLYDLGNYPFRLEVTARMNSAATETDWYIGFKSDVNAWPPVAGVYLRNQSIGSAANWQCVARQSSTETSSTTSSVALDGNWHTFAIQGDGAGTITCYIDGSQIGQVNSNIPNASTSLVASVSIHNTAASSRVQDVDTFKFWMNLARP